MPLTLPERGITTNPGSLMITARDHGTYLVANRVRGGSQFSRDFHYLSHVESGGIVVIGPTKNNTYYKEGWRFIIQLQDIVEQDFRRVVRQLVSNGKLNPGDKIWMGYTIQEDLSQFLSI